jgi:hypothetical protein
MWSVFTNPVEQWSALPSFLVGEYLFICLALLSLWHARTQGRKHLVVWFAALIAGTANDLIFMALPMVDNFWQAQATIMITQRLPLYIPCVYVCFMYLPTVSVWRLGLARLPQATLTGLAAILFYAPYDIVGAKFSWWTWHDTDKPIARRLLGVPIGSTIWVITFVATFALLLSWAKDKHPAKTVGIVASSTTVLMVVQMTVLQQLDGGTPGVVGLLVVVALYVAVVIRSWRKREPLKGCNEDRVLWGAVVGYFAILVLIMAVFDPATHRNESAHQTYGPCHVEATDIAGFTRYQFICAEDYDEDFRFDCVDELPKQNSSWYTVCGRPHDNFAKWMTWLTLICAAGATAYSYLLRRQRIPR